MTMTGIDPQFALDRQTTHAHCGLPTRREKNHKSTNGSAGEAFADRTETGFDQMGVTCLRSVVTGVEQKHRMGRTAGHDY